MASVIENYRYDLPCPKCGRVGQFWEMRDVTCWNDPPTFQATYLCDNQECEHGKLGVHMGSKAFYVEELKGE